MDFEKVSKIDFSKCKMDNWDGERVEIETYESSLVTLSVNKFGVFAYFARVEKRWSYDRIRFWGDIEIAKSYTDQVDAFIAAETARIEAEEEATNWIMVHWRDVEWLIEQKVKVRNYSSDGERWDDLFSVPKVYNHQYYHADRRTFPSGYDPEKPRFVEIECNQVARLARSGAKIYTWAGSWTYRYHQDAPTAHNGRYAIDIHTLPPGVPLHEEPKPVQRPCTKEFALSNPAFSEFRTRGCCREYWSEWLSINSGWEGCNLHHFYEFRTTAPEGPVEKKSRIISSVPVACIDMAKAGPGSQIFLRLKTDSPATYNQCVEFVCKPSEWTTLMHSERKLRIALIVDEES